MAIHLYIFYETLHVGITITIKCVGCKSMLAKATSHTRDVPVQFARGISTAFSPAVVVVLSWCARNDPLPYTTRTREKGKGLIHVMRAVSTMRWDEGEGMYVKMMGRDTYGHPHHSHTTQELLYTTNHTKLTRHTTEQLITHRFTIHPTLNSPANATPHDTTITHPPWCSSPCPPAH